MHICPAGLPAPAGLARPKAEHVPEDVSQVPHVKALRAKALRAAAAGLAHEVVPAHALAKAALLVESRAELVVLFPLFLVA